MTEDQCAVLVREALERQCKVIEAEHGRLLKALIDLRDRAKLARDNCFNMGEINASEAGVWGIVEKIAQDALFPVT